MRALITAGGTSEPIDDVRVLTNLSSGRFGAALANALVARGVDVTVLGSRSMLSHPEWLDERVHTVPFGSFVDLAERLRQHTESAPDLLLMAAAVSDYSPVPVDGKIRSDQDELVIRLKRNPKLLSTLRERCGPDTFLVGFKLLSGVTPDELAAVARRQRTKAQLDVTVANDLATFGPDLHPVVLVDDGPLQPITGDKTWTAHQVSDALLARMADQGRTHARRGSSVALVDRSGQVLVGRRLTRRFHDHWCFPGGRIEEGESALEAGLRELGEEAHVHVEGEPLHRFEVRLSHPDTPSEPATDWQISCFVFLVDDALSCAPSAELAPEWMSVEDARALSKKAFGMDTVLSQLERLLTSDGTLSS